MQKRHLKLIKTTSVLVLSVIGALSVSFFAHSLFVHQLTPTEAIECAHEEITVSIETQSVTVAQTPSTAK